MFEEGVVYGCFGGNIFLDDQDPLSSLRGRTSIISYKSSHKLLRIGILGEMGTKSMPSHGPFYGERRTWLLL